MKQNFLTHDFVNKGAAKLAGGLPWGCPQFEVCFSQMLIFVSLVF